MGELTNLIERGIDNDSVGLHICLNAPEFFERSDFMKSVTESNVMTWHTPGDAPHDFSDVTVYIDPCLNGEGPDSSQVPGDVWDAIMTILRAEYGANGENIPPSYRNMLIAVRLTNMDL